MNLVANGRDDLQTAVDKVQAALIEQTTQIISSLATSGNYSNIAANWVEYANQLQRLVPDYAIPSWLTEACSEFGLKFTPEKRHYAKLAQFVVTHHQTYIDRYWLVKVLHLM